MAGHAKLDGPWLLLQVNFDVVLVSGVKIKATGESKLNDSPEIVSLEALRANMLVLRSSNFQGATIRPIAPRH